VHWTAPYTFFTTKAPGITASIRFSTPDGRQRVVAFDVQLRDISRFTTGIRVAKHGAVLVLSADDRVVGLPGLPRFREPAAMAAAVLQPATSLGLPWIEDALAQARHPATDSTQFFSTGHGRGEQWVGVRSFESGSGELFKVIAFVPRADLHEELQDWRMAVAGATVLALLISFTLAARSAGSYSRPLLRLSEAATLVRELGADAEEGRAPGQRRSVSSLAELEEAEDWEERFTVDRIGISGIAEIDSLTRSFEHMARSLSQKAGELADYSRTLEDKVFTRTNDLREKNSTLRATLEQVREMQQQLVLREKMAALGDLVAGVAHEVNNPVGAIASASQNIELCIQKLEQAGAEGPVGAAQMGKLLRLMRTNAKVISEGSGRVTELVKSLRRFSRIDGAEWQEADLHEGLESTLTLVQHLLKDRVQVERDFGELPPIVCNSGQLNQVFMNLIVNASQAIEGPGRIRITTRHENEEVTITVEDDGKGIPEEVQGHLFEPGFTTKGVGVGTGLGLSIAYRIVHEHRGEIEVESSEGAGATFRVRLPVAPA
ncbi:MAG: ATP-binding protein, partial [Myxococcales bacterium]|nr:ATP-binding protein [Myxococcales bacterium]